MTILIGCERSGRVREAFRRRGFNAWSCDLEEAEDGSPFHIVGDLRAQLDRNYWRALIAFPECRYLSGSGWHWNDRGRGHEKSDEALEFVRALLGAPIEQIAIENPVGRISTAIRKADQTIQPYQFGEDASKRTCLWLKNLPKLRQTKFVEPRWVDGKPRWGNQTDSGQNRLAPSATRSIDRARTYPGIAEAMADQWGAWMLRRQAA